MTGKFWVNASAILCALVFAAGFFFPVGDFITPKSGLGYLLGIIGATIMSLVFLYSFRKRMKFLPETKMVHWFWLHIVAGFLGPLIIVFHTGYNLHIGSAPGHMALLSMMANVVSGFVGKYLYSRAPLKRLFALWHAVHLPVVGMLILTVLLHIYSTLIY